MGCSLTFGTFLPKLFLVMVRFFKLNHVTYVVNCICRFREKKEKRNDDRRFILFFRIEATLS